MARAKRKAKAQRSSSRNRGKSKTTKKQLRHEKALSKKLGYSVTHRRQRQERAASKKSLETAKKLAPFVPELKTLSHKTRLTPEEKAKVTRYNKKLRYFASSLHPIPKGQKKAFKGTEFAPGVNAIALNNFSSDAKVDAVGEDIFVVSNGRTWVLWKLEKAIVRNKNGQFDAAAKKAFKAQFPLEIAGKLAEQAFKELKVESVALWIASGRADRTFRDIAAFLRYLHSRLHAGMYQDKGGEHDGRKTDAGRFIYGLAIQIAQPPKPKGKAANAKKSKKSSKSKPKRR